MARTDQEILYDAYGSYLDNCKIKGSVRVAPAKENKVRSELIAKIDKNVFFLKSPTTLDTEKDKLVAKCKVLLQQYMGYRTSAPNLITALLNKKIDGMVYQISVREAHHVEAFRKTEVGGKRIDLEAVFQDLHMVKLLAQQKVTHVLENALQDKRFTIISVEDRSVYITESGRKYHHNKCPYCKGKKLIRSSVAKVNNLGLEPCKCINSNNEAVWKEDTSSKGEPKLVKQTMTAFIDESIRTNIWKKWDSSLDSKQGSYSYIICRGELKSEKEITEGNTVCKNACLLNEVQDTSFAAIEAISAVLLKIAFGYQFHGDVIIYTDNHAAMNMWYKGDVNNYLAHLFESVTVCQIAREDNTIADSIGRQEAFMNMPYETCQLIHQKCIEYDSMKKEIQFIKEYFPNPTKQIPNLVNELSLLVAELKGGA